MTRATDSEESVSRTSVFKTWHRRIGVLSALFVILLSLTGFFLNHTSALKLDQRAIRSAALLDWYGIQVPDEIQGVAIGEHWLSAIGGRIFFDRQPVGHTADYCAGGMVGATALASQIVVACRYELLILNDAGRLIERIGGDSGLPTPVLNVAIFGTGGAREYIDQSTIVLNIGSHGAPSEEQAVFFSLDTFTWSAVDINAANFGVRSTIPYIEASLIQASMQAPIQTVEAGVQWSQVGRVPKALRDYLAPFAGGDEITFEKVIQDVHSGRILGIWGVYLIDLMAALFVVLAASGLMMWRKSNS